MTVCRAVAPVLACLVFGAPPTAAQTVGATTSAVHGRVADATDAPLSDVSVVLTGTAMMGRRSVRTGSDGRYEFSAIPPGEYTLEYSRAHFRTVTRSGVYVSGGAIVTVDAVLRDLTTEDTVHVAATTSAAMDRTTTAITVPFDAQQLADLPASRSMHALLAATPGARLTRFDVGGSSAFVTGPFSAYGTAGWNQPRIEGISVSGLNPLAFALDYGTFDDVSVGLGAYGPEYPSPGLHMQFLVKSGGNRLRGTVHMDYSSGDWQAWNIDASQILRGVPGGPDLAARDSNRVQSYYDTNADAGGPFSRDRVWWYASVRSQQRAARVVNLHDGGVRVDGANATGKVTSRGWSRQRFVLFGQGGTNDEPRRLDNALRPAVTIHERSDSTSDQRAAGGVWKVEWNALVRDRWFVELLGGQFFAGRHERPNGIAPRFEDLSLLTVHGGNRDWETTLRRDQLSARFSADTDWWRGTHAIALGAEIQRETAAETWHAGYPDNVVHVTLSDVPSQVYLFQAPSRSVSALHWYAVHVRDAWRLGGALTINLGLRVDRFRVSLPPQTHAAGRAGGRAWPETRVDTPTLIAWNLLAPRLGAVYDLTGNGRTLVRLSYGRYWLPAGTDVGFLANPNGRDWWELYDWRDDDRNGRWDDGEQKRLRDTRPAAGESIDPALKPQYVIEATARLVREIAANTSLDTGVVWRYGRQPYARQDLSRRFDAFTRRVFGIDPGADGRVGTGDDGGPMEIFDLPVPTDLLPPPSYSVRNLPVIGDRHLTWDVRARRRLHRRWSLAAGFAHTWTREHAGTYLGQQVRANVYPQTPNDLIHTRADGRHAFTVWSAQVYGTYEAPWGVRLSPLVRHQSGQPYARTFLWTGLNAGPIRVLAEPIGTRRMPHVTLLDLRVAKRFAVGPERRMSLFLDVYNALNANPEQNVSWSSGQDALGRVTFERPLAIVPPRIARAGVTLNW